MVDYDYLYDDEYEEEEGYWTRRQVMILIITFIMIFSLLGYMIAPLLRDIVRSSNRPDLPPTKIPLETTYFDTMPGDIWIKS